MNVTWRKLGRVFCATGEHPWMCSHAFAPTALMLDGGARIRVLIAVRDRDQIGRCAWVDVDGRDPTRVLEVCDRPALDVGAPGTFDEHGVTPLSIVHLRDGRERLYYAGWQRGVGVRYFLFLGAADTHDDGLRFERISQAPVLDRCDGELHVRSGAHVRAVAGGGWRMWYSGGSGWMGDGDMARPRYALRHITSDDGIRWPGGGEVCFSPAPDELGFGRPCILEEDGLLRMWFGRRHAVTGYDLAYAESRDGVRWERHDDRGGLPRGAPGEWDADMVGLSNLVQTAHGTFLFYNGNGYGETGFGVAIADGL